MPSFIFGEKKEEPVQIRAIHCDPEILEQTTVDDLAEEMILTRHVPLKNEAA